MKSQKYANRLARKIRTKRLVRKYIKKAPKIPMARLPASIRPEVKKYDNAFWSAETVDNAANWSFNDKLLNIVKGDTIADRTGNKIFLKYVTARAWFANSVDQNVSKVRFMVIQDLEPSASAVATPSFSGIFEDQGTDSLDMVAPINRGTSGRYKILWEKNFELKTLYSGVIAPYAQTRCFKMKIPINKYIQYDTATASTVQSGCQLYIVAYSNLTANTPRVDMVTRTYFTDV